MLINLKVKNWMSFRNETDFSLVATKERQFKERIPKIRKNPVLGISPVAALYGGNASGKTNLCRIFSFIKKLVTEPLHEENKEIAVSPFILNQADITVPTEISLTFLTENNKIYSLVLSLTRSEILREDLILEKPGSETLVYSRKKMQIILHDSGIVRNKDAQACSRLLGKNQLFLSLVSPRLSQLQPVWHWFKDQLTIIGTRYTFTGLCNMMYPEPTDIQNLGSLLQQLDTGICRLSMEDTVFDALPLRGTEYELNEQLNENQTIELNFNGLRFLVSKKGGKLFFQKLVSYHKNATGRLIKFDLSQESEGSLRLIDILPAFIDLERNQSNKVYIIDELDRSWHYALSRRLLGIYLRHCSESTRAQLVFSTHDLMLMDQNIFRRDEMWITERNDDGESSLFTLANCGVRYDKDIRKLYLQGALGGIPRLAHFGSLSAPEE